MPSYKLYYFDAPGVAEPIRMILAYAKVEFEEVRFARGPQWLEIKPAMPWHVVPVLEVDGVQISQSRTIVRFLATRFNLMPHNDVDAAKCDEYVETIVDLRTEAKKFQREEDLQKKSVLKTQFLKERFSTFMLKLTEILQKNGNGYVVGAELSYADIFIAYTVKQINGWVDIPNNLDNFLKVKSHMEMVMNVPGIKEWVSKYP